MLKKGVHKTSIARLVECGPNTLYLWLEANHLGAYIKSKEKPAPNKGDVSKGKKRDDKAAVVVPIKKGKGKT